MSVLKKIFGGSISNIRDNLTEDEIIDLDWDEYLEYIYTYGFNFDFVEQWTESHLTDFRTSDKFIERIEKYISHAHKKEDQSEEGIEDLTELKNWITERNEKTTESQTNRQYNVSLNTNHGLNLQWYSYRGSNLTTTREFCRLMTEKEYVHESEFKAILSGKIIGRQCKINKKTGLPFGMIKGTTPKNFPINAGGWNCGHGVYPIPDAAVPKEIREKLTNPNLFLHPDYYPNVVQNCAYRILESTHLGDKAEEIRYLMYRYASVIDKAENLREHKQMNQDRFQFDVEQAIAKYQPSRKITPEQILFVHNPERSDLIDIFLITSVLNSTIQTYKEYCSSVKEMARKSAIENRKKKFSKFVEEARNALIFAQNKNGIEECLQSLHLIDTSFSNDKFDEEFNAIRTKAE